MALTDRERALLLAHDSSITQGLQQDYLELLQQQVESLLVVRVKVMQERDALVMQSRSKTKRNHLEILQKNLELVQRLEQLRLQAEELHAIYHTVARYANLPLNKETVVALSILTNIK